MENVELTDKFRELGYTVQPPVKDKTYYLVKQYNNGTEQIYIKINKKVAELESFFNFKKKELPNKLARALEELLLVYYEDLVECIFI